MPFGMGFGELVLVLIIVVVVFGAAKLPQLGDGLGKAIKNFKRAVNSQDENRRVAERQKERARRGRRQARQVSATSAPAVWQAALPPASVRVENGVSKVS